ncbi:hypothetical protein J5N97_025655 [Dioscorea zingiberensis]|uniref:Uncharacterized protein n=1 Tax=Dioscorea zingiberensis TaxID=325984 RepID=A0A9D5H671_9LILI|nr:hypothetical protein J5N97_025655 [Dioscorea zingiberensis]
MSVDQQSPRERSIELGTHIPVNKSNYGMGEFFKQEANEESKSFTKASAMKVIKQRMQELSLIRSSVLLLALHRAWRRAVLVHRRRAGSDGDDPEDLC